MKGYLPAKIILALVLSLLIPCLSFSQLSSGGLPKSFTQSIPPDPEVQLIVPPETEVLALQDKQEPVPYRFAVNLPVDLGIAASGRVMTAMDGTRIWRLTIKSEGALAMILYFDSFRLPSGSRLFIYNLKRTQLLGAFTHLNNHARETFAAGLIFGDGLTLEYNAPPQLPLPMLHISEIGYAYRGVPGYYRGETGFGGAGECQVNVNCPEGEPWAREKRSVTRIAVKRGAVSVWCSGSLVNNVRNDGTPYILTADHCGMFSSESDLSKWLFYFRYETSGCENPSKEPYQRSLTGATKIAHGGNGGNSGSDFFLVKLQSAIPDSFNLCFAGWSRDKDTPSPSGVGIHHPQGDIKKISLYTAPLVPSYWAGNPKQAFWRVNWSATANGHGTTEGGSSGSPLFDSQGRIVGTLTGGDSSCDSLALNAPDYYGMFSYHWDQNGTDSASVLKYWLDPDNTDVKSLNGWALPAGTTLAPEAWVKLFPNPVTGVLNIQLTIPGNNLIHCTLEGIGGQRYLSKEWNTENRPTLQLDLSGLKRGLYFLIIDNGEYRQVRKIIKT